MLLRHQATLEIQSELGAGSEFRIVFPAWRSVVDAQVAGITAVPQHGGIDVPKRIEANVSI